MLNIAETFGNEANMFNGDVLNYVTGQVHYGIVPTEMVYMPYDMASADAVGGFEPINYTVNQTLAFLYLNADAIHAADATIGTNDCAVLAYIRFLCVKYRLMSTRYDIAAHHVEYNQCITTALATQTVANLVANNAEGLAQERKHAAAVGMTAMLGLAGRTNLNKIFVTLVCMLAYTFRTRGHHYKADFQAKLDRLWGKTAVSGVVKGSTFRLIFTAGLHAIFPDILDQFWMLAAREGWCDDIFIIRKNVYAAGTTSFAIVNQGLNDLRLVLPVLDQKLDQNIGYIRRTCEHLAEHRWDYSVNARYYGAVTDRLDEGPIGVVGALILSCVTALVPENPLTNSEALKRVSNLAPIAGAAYSTAIRAYIRSDRFSIVGNG